VGLLTVVGGGLLGYYKMKEQERKDLLKGIRLHFKAFELLFEFVTPDF
jgi:hypothetical protein